MFKVTYLAPAGNPHVTYGLDAKEAQATGKSLTLAGMKKVTVSRMTDADHAADAEAQREYMAEKYAERRAAAEGPNPMDPNFPSQMYLLEAGRYQEWLRSVGFYEWWAENDGFDGELTQAEAEAAYANRCEPGFHWTKFASFVGNDSWI